MATIDVGPGARDRASAYSITTLRTCVDINNPANDTGTLDTFEIFANTSNMTNVKIGTFSGSYTSYDDRDYETIGTVTYGSKQTFTGKNCDVSSGDYLGFSADGGKIEQDTSGSAGFYVVAGDKFGSGSNTYALSADDALSIYATGTTSGGATVKPHYYYLQQ